MTKSNDNVEYFVYHFNKSKITYFLLLQQASHLTSISLFRCSSEDSM